MPSWKKLIVSGSDASLNRLYSQNEINSNTSYEIKGSAFAALDSSVLKFGDYDGNAFETALYDENSNEVARISNGKISGSNASFNTLSVDGTISSPSSLNLDVVNDITLDAGGNDIRLVLNGTEYGKFKNDSSDLSLYASIQNKDILFKGNDGGSTITALQLDMSNGGKALFNDDVVAFSSSDKDLKDNITPIENPIDKIKEIGGYEFDWNNKSSYEGHDVGVIAQEIEKVLPEVVTTRDNGYKAVKYEKIVALLIEGIKEQQLQIDELKHQLNGKN